MTRFRCSKCGEITKEMDFSEKDSYLYIALKKLKRCESCARKMGKEKKDRSINLHYLFLSVAYYIDKETKGKTFETAFGDFLSKHHTVLQFIEYLFVGLIGMIPNFFVFTFLLGINTHFAWFLGFLSGAFFKFFLAKYEVFT